MSIKTPLYALHTQHNGKIVDFAGYALPVFYAGGGLLNEHHHTRTRVSVFDVSHMGQVGLPADDTTLAALVPADLFAIPEGASKYTLLTNAAGGVIDDCIVSNDGARGWFIVLNASRKAVDIAYIRAAMTDAEQLREYQDRALLAVQGPAAATAIVNLFPAATSLKFMYSVWTEWEGSECRVSRCGYTGEDGFEISVPADLAEKMAVTLLESDAVRLAGLGARDSLRLEAGLCLYGNELDENTSPIEAGLLWTISKSCRLGSGYPGADVILRQINDGAPRKLIGLLPQGKMPVRKGAEISLGHEVVGIVTSGTFSPTLQTPIALAYVATAAATANGFIANVRGKQIPCQRTDVPFVPHKYHK